MAVLHRSSLGVAALQAEHRFHISPGQLSTFVLLQLGVYAAMQIPTGILVDRLGPRRLLLVASVLLGGSQLVFAVATSFPVALAARAVLGCGDALSFISVLRYCARHFPQRYPVMVGVSGLIGISGNILATLPLTFSLQHAGWTPTFATLGGISFATGFVTWLLVPPDIDSMPARPSAKAVRAQVSRVRARVRESWTLPTTRLGFWVHFAAMSTTTSLGVLWGFPYLVEGLGFSKTGASTVLLLSVVFAASAVVVVGWAIGRRPVIRVPFAFAVCVVTVIGWICLLALPAGEVPHWAMTLLVCFAALGGPAATVAFALARDYNPPEVVGTATGLVNAGGYSATITGAVIIGAVLNVIGTSPTDYRWALATMLLVQVFGIAQVVRWWLRGRIAVLEEIEAGRAVPVPISRRRWDVIG